MTYDLDPLLRLPKVLEATGISRAAIYKKMNEGTFPPAVRLGPKSVAWRQSDVSRWIAELVEA